MKSNITKMITMCMCMVVVGFASEGKQALHAEKELMSIPAQQQIVEQKDIDYKVAKRIATAKAADYKVAKRIATIKTNAYQAKKMANAHKSVNLKENPIFVELEINRDCVDTDNGATDTYGDGCAGYTSYPSWCNGYDDDDFVSSEMCCACGGGSDDGGGEPTCEDQGLFDCGDGQCIPTSYVCDGSSEFCNAGWGADCANGADEGLESCGYADECVADPTCADTACGYWLNYGYDCAALGGWGYDCSLCDAEGACPAPPTCEEQGYVDCGDGQCIYASWECDGWADCSNGSDEADCAPASCEDQGLWDCGDGQCIPGGYVCDGSSEFCNAGWGPDCANGADEGLESCGYTDDCEVSCADSGGYEDCSGDGDCAPGSWVGDGYCDGEDQPYGYDLTCYDNDGGDCDVASCEDQGLYDCGDGQCIYTSWECDGWADCANGADEADCGAASCADQGLWDCGDGQCIPGGYVCDGSSEFCNAGWGPDCANGADEGLDACGYADECGPGVCEDCVYDFTPYGAECCDAAADAFGLSCAALEGNYGWDCEGCSCPLDEDGWDDLTCAEQGALDDCADDDCCPTSWVGDGFADGSDQPYGCDLTCYECDGGDVASDCAGTCEGTASNDDCGVCDGDNSSCADCAGVPNGDSFTDCAGDCVEGWLAGYLGDGFCDDGSWGVDLTCESCDNGDCNQSDDPDADCYVEPECSFFDCVGTCADGYESWVGDGFCDGTPQQYGLDFTCLDCDGGDCAGECGCELDIADGACDCDGNANDECGVCGGDNSSCADCAGTPNGDAVEDCVDDDCVGGSWVGDGYCDGADQAWGADLTCYDCDGGDCEGACGCDDNDSCNDCCGEPNGDNSSCGGSGDVNGGGVDVTDVVAIVSAILETDTLDECQANEADLNGDGTVNVLDVIGIVDIILSGGDDGGDDGGVACDEGYVADCADDDCCPDSWIGDGFADCEEQAYGCDLTCYENDGGDCDEATDDGGDTGGSEACSDCEFDWTPYGAECCDTAWDAFGIDCASLEGTYGWDCSGCSCPGDTAAVCGDGACSGDEDHETCPEDCEEASACATAGGNDSWLGDGYCDSINNNETCGFDTGDCCPTSCADSAANDCPDNAEGCYSACADGTCCGTCDTCADPNDSESSDCEAADGGGDGGGCGDGYVDDCDGSGDCCSESWIGDGYGDCEDQAFGCDLTCYDNDGGDCAAADDGGGDDGGADGCLYDWTAYGAADCDAAWDQYGLTCEDLEAYYGWDCAGCACDYPAAEDCAGSVCGGWLASGYTCDDLAYYGIDCSLCDAEGACGAPEGCAEGTWDCGDGQCIPNGYVCDGSSEFCNAGWGPDCANGADEGLESCGYTDDCAAGCADGTVDDCSGDGDCAPDSWVGDGWCDGTDQPYGYDLTCYDDDGGDCAAAEECVNDDSSADAYGDTCSSWYDSYESPGSSGCEGAYNTDDFDAGAQCCACGGGSTGGRATVDSDKVMKMQLQSKLHGTDIRNMAIKTANAVDKVSTIVNKDRSLPVYNNSVKSKPVSVKSSGMIKSILKDVGKNPADVIKPEASLNRKATGFESKLQRAESVKLIQTAEGLKYEADGFVGFEITLSHGADFEINVTNSAFIADYNTVGNTTKVIVVNPETADLFTSTGDYEIVDVIAGTSGGAALSADIVSIPTVFGLNDAYPNPFNPTTSVELAMPHDGFVSVKVYNLMGQVIATLHEGNLTANSYSFTWDAADVASGMYLLQAEAAGNVDVQKIMLMK